jgi:hypothetical protein
VARKNIFVSDLSGQEIADGKGATISIRFNDARKGTIVLDVSDEEAESWAVRGAGRHVVDAAQSPSSLKRQHDGHDSRHHPAKS